MKDELKTLMDIEKENLKNPKFVPECIDEIRSEAVKWVKELEKEQEKLMKGCGEREESEEGIILSFSNGEASISECGKNNQYCPMCSVKISSPLEKIKWIKHFFNLTETDMEDLKNEN